MFGEQLRFDLTNKFPDFSSPQLSDIFEQGSIGPQDLYRCTNILLRDLEEYLENDIYITFDDIHLLPSISITNTLLGYLLDVSPPKLHFILVSRYPVNLKSKILRNGAGVSYLETADLALNSIEIEDLFTNVLDKTISRREAVETRGGAIACSCAFRGATFAPYWCRPLGLLDCPQRA